MKVRLWLPFEQRITVARQLPNHTEFTVLPYIKYFIFSLRTVNRDFKKNILFSKKTYVKRGAGEIW